MADSSLPQAAPLLLLLLLLLVGVAAAEYGWRARHEYAFSVEGRTLTGVSLRPQFAGVHYEGGMRIQVRSPGLLHMKLQNMTYFKIHGEGAGDWWTKDAGNEDAAIKVLPVSEKTVVLKLDRGHVASVTMANDIEDWEQNFINGIISQLQLDMVGANLLHDTNQNVNLKHRLDKTSSVYRVMEDSVVGKCEVIYEVSPYPKAIVHIYDDPAPRDDLCGNRNYLQIVKTRNFSNCEVNVEYHFGLPKFKGCSDGNSCGNIWSRSSLTRLLGCGERDDFLVLNSVRNSRVLTNLHYHNGSQASVNSFLNLTLHSVKPTSRQFNSPSDSFTVKNLLFKSSTSSQKNKSYLSSICKEQKNAQQSSTVKNLKSSGNKAFDTPSEEVSGPSRHKDKTSIKRNASSEMLMDAPNKTKNKSKKNKVSKKKNQVKNPVPKSSESMENSSEEIKSQLGNFPKADANYAPFLPFSPYSKAYRQERDGSCLTQQFKEMMSDIVNDFESSPLAYENRTLEKVYIVVQMCQTMSFYDLRKLVTDVVQSKLNQNQRSLTERKLYRDVVTVCGTNPAFAIVKSWIEDKVFTGEEAARLLATLPTHLITPDSRLVKQFYSLTRSPAVRDDPPLKTSAVLAFSNLLRVACEQQDDRQARYSTYLMESTCTSKDVARYIPWLASQLETDSDNRLLYIRALGNTGSVLALPHLQAVAQSNSYTAIQRSVAIFSMKFEVFRNKAMIPYLLSILHNYESPPSVRISAVSILFYAKPTLNIWQRIAISTWYEPSLAVAGFIRSSLWSFSNAKDPIYEDLSRSASTVYSLSKPISFSPRHAYNLMRTNIVDNLQQIIQEQFEWMPGPEASNLYYRHTVRVGDSSRVGFDGEVWLTNTDAFMTALKELFYPAGDVTRARPMLDNLPRSTRWIHDALKIEARTLPRLEGALRFSFGYLNEILYDFDKKMSADLVKAARKLVEEMKGGKDFHYQKFDHSSLAIGTASEMGFLLNMHIDVPWVLRTVGNISFNNISKELNMETSFAYTSSLMADVSIYTPWDQSVHVAATYGSSMINLPPITYRAKLNEPMSMLEMSIAMKEPKQNDMVFQHVIQPFTAQEDVFSLEVWSRAKTTKTVHMREPSQEIVGIPHVEAFISTEAKKGSPYKYMEEAITVQGFPMIWSTIEESSLEVNLKNISDVTVTIALGEGALEDGSVKITRNAGEAADSGDLPPQDQTTPDQQPETTTPPTTTTTEPDETTATTESTTTDATTTPATEETTPLPDSTATTTTTNYEENRTVNGEESSLRYSIDYIEDPSNFNASQLQPFVDDSFGSGYNYLLNQILKGLSNGRAFVLGMNATVNAEDPERYSIFSAYAGGLADRLRRIGVFYRDNNTNNEVSATVSMFTSAAPVLNITEIIYSNILAHVYFDFDHKNSDDEHQRANIEGIVSRSEKKMAAIRKWGAPNSDINQKCIHNGELLNPLCYNSIQSAILLNQYNFTIFYNDKMKESFSRDASRWLRMAKYTGLPYLAEESDGDGEMGNSMQVTVALDNEATTADVALQTSSSATTFGGVPLPRPILAGLQLNPEYNLLQRITTTGYCGISNTSVITFDGVSFEYDLDECWHLMAKDCSGKNRIAILVKHSGHQTNDTEMEINLDNYKIISLTPGSQIRVNQDVLDLKMNEVAEIRDKDGTLLIEMAVTPDNAIKMALPYHGFLVLYSRNTVILQAASQTRGRLCGLCGDNDNSALNEFRSPRAKLEATAQDFASSYLLRSPDCKRRPTESNKNQ